ncbi:transcriptional repressor LexA [Elusimicrobiota bacterium]
MRKKMSNKQHDILDFISSKINMDGIPPTLREICSYFGFSSLASPRYHLKVLSERGYLRLRDHTSRGIELVNNISRIPILGEISAGLPVDAIENIDGYLDLINTFGRKKPLFCLKIKGDSMEGAGIMEDDMVIVRKQSSVEIGQLVAAMIDGEALVKRLKVKEGRYVLHAENPEYPDISAEGASVIGKIVGIVRNYEPVPLY